MNRKATPIVIDFGNEDDPNSIKGRARQHEQHRERVITTLLAHLYLMSANNLLPSSRSVAAKRAYWQDYSGSEAAGTEAAHCVPCQLRINGKRPEQYIRRFNNALAEEIAALFGKTNMFLPAIFNKCDSRCEANGLVDAFWDAAIQVIDSGLCQSTKIKDVTNHVRNAFGFYSSLAMATFDYVVQLYEIDKNRLANFGKTAEMNEVKAKKVIVHHYRRELMNPVALSDVIRFGEIKEMIEIYDKF
ncbi:hypothetical protein BH10ACI1_BH10ACI1_21960 [soil metagenome]